MDFSSVRSITFFLLLNFMLANTQSTIKDISLKGKYTCSLQPSNQLLLELRAYDELRNATRLNAINSDEEEITTCTVSGSGPFYLSSTIDLTDDSELSNVCGMKMTTVNGHKIYNWLVKAYTYPIEYYPNNVGFILSLHCNTSDLSDGRVETLIDINVPNLVASPLDPTDVTGVDSIATDANIIFTANLYPNGRSVPTELQGAKGFYAYNCFSATSPNMQADRERFIDEKGCSMSNATYAPSTAFQQVTNTGDYIKIEAKYAKAVLIGNKKKIYISCSLGKCDAVDDACCNDVCLANTNNAQCSGDTSVIYSTSFTVQDQNAHRLTPTTITGTTELMTINSGGTIRIIAFNTPGGIDGNADLLNAKGFYVYSCRYATNKQDLGDNPTLFVNAEGCLVQNTKLTPVSDFAVDDTVTATGGKYATISGQITVRNVRNIRLWVQCNVGKCTVIGHNYCKKRCRAVNNFIGGAVDLGYRGHEFTISVLDTQNEPALALKAQGPNGQILTSSSDPVNVGDFVNFGVDVTPGGTGTASAAFANAKGIFIESCYATKDNSQQQVKFIEKGCPVPGSPYKTSRNCVDATEVKGVPPFKVDCGSFIVPEEGNITQTCDIRTCTTVNNIFCDDRCSAGEIQPDSNVEDPDVTATTAFMSQLGDNRRTAVKSEELRTIIAAICAVAAVLILLAVFVGTCIVVQKQKSLAKRRLDNRFYYY